MHLPTCLCLPVRSLCALASPLLTALSSSTMWYTREEQALVIGSFYSMNGFQQCVGGLIAYGIAQIENAALKNWQILFTVSVLSCRKRFMFTDFGTSSSDV